MFNKKNNIYAIIIVLIILSVGYVLTAQPKQTAQIQDAPTPAKPVKIGIIASLTGKGSARGESAKQGLILAKTKMEKLHPDMNIELVYQDVPLSQPKLGLSAFKHLVETEKVNAIIGPMGSNVALSITPLVDEIKMPVIIHTASTLKATRDNEYVFRLWPTALNYATSVNREINKRGYKNVVALTVNRNNSVDFINALQKITPELTANKLIETEQKDFRTDLLKLNELNPDALLVNLFEGQIGLASMQARQMNISIPIITSNVMSQVELEVGPKYLEGAWFARFSGYNDKAREEFIELFGNEPPAPDSAAAAHDALIVLSEAINSVGVDGESVKDYIYAKEKFTGVIGEFRFDEEGNAQVPLSIKTVKNGAIVDLYE